MTMDMSELTKAVQGPGTEQMKAMFAKMFGEGEKMKVYLAVVNDTTAAVGYVNDAALKQTAAAVRAGERGLAAQEDVRQTVALLPEQVQAVMLVSPSGWIKLVQDVVQSIGAPPGFTLPEFPDSPPLAFSTMAVKDGVQVDMVVPADASKAIRDYVDQVRQAAGGN
jgi:hypothetical protein